MRKIATTADTMKLPHVSSRLLPNLAVLATAHSAGACNLLELRHTPPMQRPVSTGREV